jgi:hypothetical protein
MVMHSADRRSAPENSLLSGQNRRSRARFIHRDDPLFPRHFSLRRRRSRVRRSEGGEPLYAWYRPDLYRSFAGALSQRDQDLLPRERSARSWEHGTFPTAIVVAGDPGAEEEVFGAMLAERLGYRHASLAGYLCRHATITSSVRTPDPVESMVDQMISTEGPTRLWDLVIASAEHTDSTSGVIIDGVRRVELTTALQSRMTTEMVVIYYDVDKDVRRLRLARAASSGRYDVSQASSEALSLLRDQAATVVSGEPRRAVADVVEWLSRHFGPPESEQPA